MTLTQLDAPYYQALLDYAQGGCLPFHMPGHMKGAGAPAEFVEMMGKLALAADTTQVLDFDDIHRPFNYLKAAQELASQAYGAQHTWFLLNGSSCGNMAMIMATVGPDEEIVVPRNAHRSVYAGLVMSGARPVYAQVSPNPKLGVGNCVEPEAIAQLLSAHLQAKACLFTSVTPYGACADVEQVVHVIHQHGVPALVDEAWGPHLAFAEGFPTSALAVGADLVVHSAHKLLSALSQSSFLHQGGNLVSTSRVSDVLRMLQSTSPNCLLAASLDCCRRQMALHGRQLWAKALLLAQQLRTRLQAIAGLEVFGQETAFDYDFTRVVLSARNWGISGPELERHLRYQAHIQVEMSDPSNVVFIISPAHTQAQIDKVVEAFEALRRARASQLAGQSQVLRQVNQVSFPEVVLTPRQAFYQSREAVPLTQAAGRIAGEVITPYPPGIPFVCPGERLEVEHLQALRQMAEQGIGLEGVADSSLQTVVCLV